VLFDGNPETHTLTFYETNPKLTNPAGNVYTIANISQRDAYIFFAQSRKVLDDSDEPPPLPREKETLPVKGKAKVVPKK
jgi:hypothetical protein